MRQIVTSLTDPESSELLESGDVDGGGGEFLQDDHGVDDDALDLDEIKGDEKAMLQWKPDSMLKVTELGPAPPQGAPDSSGWLSDPRTEADPLGTQPLPRMLQRATCKGVDCPSL